MDSFSERLQHPLALPINAENPVGVDIRDESTSASKYYAFRDIRSAARAEERRLEAAENSGHNLTVCTEWSQLRDLCTELLRDDTKDVEIVSALVEAQTRLEGLSGLADSFALLRILMQTYGSEMFPTPEEALTERYEALSGLNGAGREGALIQTLRLVPLAPNRSYGDCCLWFLQSGQDGAVAEAVADAGQAAMQTHFQHVQSALENIRACDAMLTEQFGADAPPLGRIIDVLEDIERRVAPFAGSAGVDTPSDAESPMPESAPSDAAPAQSRPISSREDAFAKLLEVAAYFRRAEPHSPISKSIETLVHRGRMDFMSLLEELIPDESTRRHVMTTAGINPVLNKTENEE